MYGGIKDLPRLRNYDDALTHWQLIKPLRGRATDTRPLCLSARRKTHVLIERTTVDGVDAVACKLYRTNVLTFVSDGRIVIDNSYQSMSTNQFVSAILEGRAYMGTIANQTWLNTYSGQWLVGTELVLRRHPHNETLSPVSPHPYCVHVLDRKKFNQVKAAYVPFIKHLRNVAKLVEASDARSPMPRDRLTTAADQTREGWGPLISYLLAVSTRRTWVGGWTYTLDVERGVKHLLDEIKTQHADEIFIKEPVPMGHYKADSNKRYVS